MNEISSYYIVTPSNSPANTAIVEITKGKYEGIRYYYKQIKFNEPEPEETASLQFSYEIDFVPEQVDPNVLTEHDQKDFEQLIGDIVVDLILKDYDSRTNDTSTPVAQ